MANNAPPNAAVRDAQSLLAAYPMSSAVPSAHVARHLDHLTIAAPPPSFVQPDYYRAQTYRHHGSPPPYTEYAAEVAYMAQPNQPQADAGYWQNTRNDALRYVQEQAGHNYTYPQWTAPSSSSYPTTALANSMFGYPTPPPLPVPTSMASSSLAGALGPTMMPVNKPAQHPPQNQARPDQSATFFDEFLAAKSQQMQQRQMLVTEGRTTHSSSAPPRTSNSLNLAAHMPHPGSLTPKKRKMVVELVSTPSAKRVHLNGFTPGKSSLLVTPSKNRSRLGTPSTSHTSSSTASTAPTTVPPTPSSTAVSTPTTHGSTGLKRKTYTFDCIEISSQPHPTPSAPRLGKSSSSPTLLVSEKKRKVAYDTEDDDDELNLTSPVKPLYYGASSSPSKAIPGTGRKTHERDERAPIEKLITLLQEIFDAEDSLPPDPSPSDLPQDYFMIDSSDLSKPQLAPAIVKKLTKYVGQVAKPGRSINVNLGSGGTPHGQRAQRGKGRLGDVDTALLSRLLRTLGRSTRIGEEVDAFEQAGHQGSEAQPVPQKSPKKRKSKTPVGGEEHESDGGEEKDRNEIDIVPKTPKKDKGKSKATSAVPIPTDLELEKLLRKLELGKDGILAAECAVALLGSERLAKSLYSEELITSCLSVVKNQLERVIYPFVEACGDTSAIGMASPLLHYFATLKCGPTATSTQHQKSPTKTPAHTSTYPSSKPPSSSSNKTEQCRRLLSETFQALSAVLPRLSTLVSAENVAMSEGVVVKAVYVGIGPFFVGDAAGGGARDGHNEGTKSKGRKEKGDGGLVMATFGKSAMRGLRLDALALIRSIFANHDEQRSWIIEEILSSLIKLSDTKQKAGQFRLREGRSIRTVSALLLQLVQTSAHDVRVGARRIEKKRQAKFALKRQESLVLESQQSQDEEFLDEEDEEEIRLYTSGLNSANKAAKTIILFLTQRSGKGKATKNSNEAEYRTIFDNLISDLLVVLFWPEWPAASLLLSIACMYMVGSLEDVKSASGGQSDNNAGKTMALDHLGVIAARIRATMLKVREDKNIKEEGGAGIKAKWRGLRPMDEIVAKADIKELDRLLASHKDVAAHLSKRSSEDQAYDSAQELTGALLGQELASALKKVDAWIDHDPDDEGGSNIKDQKKVRLFGDKVKSALRGVWKDQGADVFDIGSHDEVIRIDHQAEEIGAIQSLRNAFNPILNVILQALDAPAIFMRTKALRALGQIVTSDATILAAPNVRSAIESHLLDSSSAVRDAAVELIGKYMIDSPEVADDYYSKVADRIADTGLSVRKRVIKLLKTFYFVTNSVTRQIDIATKLVLRMVDEDDTVRDLATKTVEDLWFPSSAIAKTSQEQDDGTSILSKVAVIMGVAAHFRDRQSPLEDLLHKIMSSKEGSEAAAMHSKYEEICGALIDGLVDASDLPGFSVMNCIRTINLITSAYPSVVSAQIASTLLPYLKNAANNVEDQPTCDYLLRIFRASIPHMPRTAAKFGQELQAALQPMIIRPTAGGIATLQEAIACMCAVVRHLTHDFKRLVALLKSCNGRLQDAVRKPQERPVSANEQKTLATLIFIVSLLAEHCNFDQLRAERPGEFPELDSVSQGSIIEHIYDTLLELYEKHVDPGLRARVLQCLGFLFRAQPTLMTMERSATIMDSIFSAPEEDGRARLLKIIQDFLIAESIKHAAKEKEGPQKSKIEEVNMEELVGNTDGFADSGVSSAVVQRYLDPILAAALSQNVHTQTSAIDILTFTIKQGLAHPLQSFPTIVALETSPNTALSSRASGLHTILHHKHTSLLNSRYTNSARASFDYQVKISPNLVRGYRLNPNPVAVLQRWYSLVREKRTSRQDFLKALVKVFQERPSFQSAQDDIDFTRYMAENFSAFEYKTQEEVITVIKYLTTVLSTTGTHILEILSPSHLLSSLRPSADGAVLPTSDNQSVAAEDNLQEKIPYVRSSVVIAMVMLLKAHLKTLYSLSEDKCSKFVIGKRSAIGDKPAVRRHDKPISWDRLAFATKPILSTADATSQKSTFLEIWNEDGVAAEPEDEFAE